MQVCTIAAGQTLVTAWGRPVRPSQTAIRTSSTPLALSSPLTRVQDLVQNRVSNLALEFAADVEVEGLLQRVPVPGDLQVQHAHLGSELFGGETVAAVPAALAGRLALLVAEVIGQLNRERPFHNRLRQLRQQPALASNVDALLPSVSDQPVDQFRLNEARLVPIPPRSAHLCSVEHFLHRVSCTEPQPAAHR